MSKQLITITEAAEMLGVSMMTLRRWDKSGKLVAIRPGKGSHRLYRREDIEKLISDLFALAKTWVSAGTGFTPDDAFYCPTSGVFQARLQRMEAEMLKRDDMKEIFSLVSSVAGEIGNNSFDHNLGLWPDTPGIFFAYDLTKKMVVLADRGRGVLFTLKRVKKALHTHSEALETAFTEVITGRAPEHRGNGLKYVRRIVTGYPLDLLFQTGDAVLRLRQDDRDVVVENANGPVQGCLVLLRF